MRCVTYSPLSQPSLSEFGVVSVSFSYVVIESSSGSVKLQPSFSWLTVYKRGGKVYALKVGKPTLFGRDEQLLQYAAINSFLRVRKGFWGLVALADSVICS